MNRVLKPNHTPSPGAFKYKDDDTGEVFTHPYFVELRKMARKHRSVNNLPYLSDDAFEDNACRQKPEICGEERPSFITQAMKFVKAMAYWASKGFPIADDETMQKRVLTCGGDDNTQPCEYFVGWKALGVSCRKCGCSKLKIAVATEKCPIGKW